MSFDNEPIDWDALKGGYNRIYHTDFKTVSEMLINLYSKEKTLERVGKVLGIAGQTVNEQMKRLNIPRLHRGHRGFSAFQVAYRKIENPEQYTQRELARMLGCSCGYIPSLKQHNKKER